jgi:Leucine-rich repeat (LRR) protein
VVTQNNKIETINHKFCALTNLTELSLSYNSIKKLPHFWGKLCKLRALWVSGNALQSLPSDEIVSSPEKIPSSFSPKMPAGSVMNPT